MSQENDNTTNTFIASNAMIVGNVKLGRNVRIMYGAQIIAENSSIEIGDNCVVLENAVLRGTKNFPLSIGENCLIGPNTHLVGCTLKDQVFVATGATVFHGAVIKQNSEIRINAVVHVNSVLEENSIVPINWVAVGNPAQYFSAEKHLEIWEEQQKMEFNKTVYGLGTSFTSMPEICLEMGERLKEHFLSMDNKSNL